MTDTEQHIKLLRAVPNYTPVMAVKSSIEAIIELAQIGQACLDIEKAKTTYMTWIESELSEGRQLLHPMMADLPEDHPSRPLVKAQEILDALVKAYQEREKCSQQR